MTDATKIRLVLNNLNKIKNYTSVKKLCGFEARYAIFPTKFEEQKIQIYVSFEFCMSS